MVNIIVAFPKADTTAQYAGILEEAGHPVFRLCTSGSEVKRALNQCYDGIVLCSSRLPDATADALAWDLGVRALMLVAGKPAQLALCEHPDIFRLELPCSKGELTSSVNILVQLYRMRLPRRSEGEKQLIMQAKQVLMLEHDMTEMQAHRYLQKSAMDRGMKLTDYAALLLRNRQ